MDATSKSAEHVGHLAGYALILAFVNLICVILLLDNGVDLRNQTLRGHDGPLAFSISALLGLKSLLFFVTCYALFEQTIWARTLAICLAWFLIATSSIGLCLAAFFIGHAPAWWSQTVGNSSLFIIALDLSFSVASLWILRPSKNTEPSVEQLESDPDSDSPARGTKSDARKRSDAIDSLAVLNAVLGIFLALPVIEPLFGLFFRNPNPARTSFLTLWTPYLVAAVLLIVSAVGLRMRKHWGRIINLILAYFFILGGSVSLVLAVGVNIDECASLLGVDAMYKTPAIIVSLIGAFVQFPYAINAVGTLLPAKTRELFR
jgi:hypothetical protein